MQEDCSGDRGKTRTVLIPPVLTNLLRIDALRVMIYPNDHSPEHVHVIGADREAVLSCIARRGPVTPVSVTVSRSANCDA